MIFQIKMVLSSAFMALFFTQAQVAGSLSTPCVDGISFTIFSEPSTFLQAIAICEDRRMELAVIRNIRQFNQVENILTEDLIASFAWLGNKLLLCNR